MAVLDEVERALVDGKVPDDWRTALCRSLAADLDAQPNASMAKELRSLMAELLKGAEVKASPADEIRARRERQRRVAETG